MLKGKRKAWCCIDNASVAYIVPNMVTASRDLMPEFCLLERLLRHRGLELDAKCLPFADRRERLGGPTIPIVGPSQSSVYT